MGNFAEGDWAKRLRTQPFGLGPSSVGETFVSSAHIGSPEWRLAEVSSFSASPPQPEQPAVDVNTTGSSDGSEATTPRDTEAGKDDTPLASEGRTTWSGTHLEDLVGDTSDVFREIEWDISESVQCHVETGFLRSIIACVHVFLENIAVLPGERLQWDAHKVRTQILGALARLR